VLAGRSAERLRPLARELGDLEMAVADVRGSETVEAPIGEGDVLVSTVGPFTHWGGAAVAAAIANHASYLDCAGEPPFVRRVFEEYGPLTHRAGIPLVPSFASDCVPGNLAAAIAFDEAGESACRIDIGYFMPGDRRGWDGGGSRASYLAAPLAPNFVWRDAIKTERGAARVRSFELADGQACAISAGTSEHFALPRLHPQLREVNSYLGLSGGPPRLMQGLSLLGAGMTRESAVTPRVGRGYAEGLS
jgi:hypothetical protein